MGWLTGCHWLPLRFLGQKHQTRNRLKNGYIEWLEWLDMVGTVGTWKWASPIRKRRFMLEIIMFLASNVREVMWVLFFIVFLFFWVHEKMGEFWGKLTWIHVGAANCVKPTFRSTWSHRSKLPAFMKQITFFQQLVFFQSEKWRFKKIRF